MQTSPDAAEQFSSRNQKSTFQKSLLMDQGQPNISNTRPHHTVQLPNCGPTSLIITPWCQPLLYHGCLQDQSVHNPGPVSVHKPGPEQIWVVQDYGTSRCV